MKLRRGTDWKLRAFGEKKRREQLEAVIELQRTRIADLERILVEMKREGFQPPPPPTEEGPRPDPLPPEIANALSEVAQPGTTLWGREASLALEEMGQGVQPAEIAKRIREGGSYHPFKR